MSITRQLQVSIVSSFPEKGGLTLGSIASLVVVGEPLEVLVLDPGHPVLILVVVALLDPLEVALALLLVFGQRVEGLLLLVFAHSVPAVAGRAGCVLELFGHRGMFGLFV